jgi:site-specific recombinase XerD
MSRVIIYCDIERILVTMQENKKSLISDEFMNTIWIFFESGLSTRTRKEYMAVLNNFCKITQADPLHLHQKDATLYNNELIDRYRSGRLSYSTVVMRISVMRTICGFVRYRQQLHGFDYINYFDEITIPDVDKTINVNQLPSEKELDAIFDIIEAYHDDKALLIYSLALKCGLTSSEICALKVESICCNTNDDLCIQLPSKNYHSRIIKLPKDVATLLDAYISNHEIFTGEIFLNKRKTTLKIRDAQRLLNKYIQIGIDAQKVHTPITFQVLRHCAFKYMLAGGASETEVAKYGGITSKWMSRYKEVVHQYQELDTIDYSMLTIKAPKY